MRPASAYWRLFVPLAGALTLLNAFWIYRLGLYLSSQVSLERTLGTLGVIGIGLTAVAALLAAALTAAEAPTRLAAAVAPARALFFLGGMLNVGLLGLAVFYWNPIAAPKAVLAAAAFAMVGLAIVFWRKPAAEQTLICRTFYRLGLAALLVPALASPWVAWSALHFVSRVPASPVPPVTPRLRADAPRRILLITFDGLRASTTSMQAPKLDATPALAAIARESTWFSDAQAAAEKSQASLTAILTGMPPADVFRHVRNRSGYIPRGMVSGLGSFLEGAGYQRHFATMLLHPSVLGLDHEFQGGAYHARTLATGDLNTNAFLPLRESYDWMFSKLLQGKERTEAWDQFQVTALRKTLDDAHAQLKTTPDRSFMWVHLGAPHEPCYRVPRRASDAVLARGGFPNSRQVVKDDSDPRHVALYQAFYEDYVRFADGELERFVERLKADGLWDDALVVVTSDHGEEMRPGYIGHGAGEVTSEIGHVPLLVRVPHQRDGRRVDAVAHHVDIVPTILSAVLEPESLPKGFSGKSLLEPLPAARELTRYGMFKYHTTGDPMYHRIDGRDVRQWSALLDGGYTYMLSADSREQRLYHRTVDPGEQRDLSAARPAIAAAMMARLKQRIPYPAP